MLDKIAGNGVRCILVESPDRFARDLTVQLTGHDLIAENLADPGDSAGFLHRRDADRGAGPAGAWCDRPIRKDVPGREAQGGS
jgi:hypothetical protein